MIDGRLLAALERVAVRYRRLRFLRSLAGAWLATALVSVLCAAVMARTAWRPANPVALLAAAGLIAATGCIVRHFIRRRDYHWVAQQIEARYPELKSCLLTAIEQRPELPGGQYGFLQDRVIRQALYHAQQHAWPRVVSSRQMAGAALLNLATLGMFVAVLAGLGWQASQQNRAALAGSNEQASAGGKLSVTVEPGNTEVERGTSLLVLARYRGEQPADATLVYQAPAGEANRLTMSKTLKDPVFGGRIPAVDAPLEYRVELDGYQSETFRVKIFEYPKLVRADAKLVYPAYAGLEERLVQDVRTISAPEGTELTLICRLNKAVGSATLNEKDAAPIALAPAEGETNVYQATIHCDRSRRLELVLVDDEGRRNKLPAEFAINVLPNRPPDLKLAFPARDVEVSPLEETDVKATAWDDYGLKRFGLAYAMAGAEPKEVVLAQEAAAKVRHELADVIRFEELKAEPDQLLSYYFWAEDLDASGNLRRTESDMYFAEVRPFEEIFRQGEQPPGGQQQQQQWGENAQAAEKLAELQKQIIAATWKLIRREAGKAPSDAFKKDVHLVGESQATAWEQATELSQKLEDPQSQKHAAAVITSMMEAIEQLSAAEDGPDLKPLQPALAAEQAAYQALLKLRAREHRVIRGQQQQRGGGGGGSSRSQEQLQQLELNNDENRYETERAAQTPEQQQNRENSQVLNRLAELARRQNDLNERLKELQSALEEAKTEQDREEIQRQLKRLREEQQQILRDTDELKSRMETPENQERMADSRQQLEQTREQVRRAADALEQEQVSQAAAAGTRAERDFQELRNAFRRRTSGQFTEEMREMREAARQLDEKEKQLAERLAADEPKRESRSLRDDDASETQKLPLEFEEQRRRVADLVERMQETIKEAEEVEPLLSERLYDTARKAIEQDPSRVLEAAELSVRRGLTDDARQQEGAARQSISEMREGVERAAESVLGDETEALRRAEQELKRLTEELNDEIARNTGEPQDSQQPGEGPSRRGERSQENQADGNAQGGSQQENADQQREGRGEGQAPGGVNRPNQERRGQGRPGGGERNEAQSNEGQPNGGQPGDAEGGQGQPGENQQPQQQRGEGQPGQGQPGRGQPGEQTPSGQQRGGNRNGGAPRNVAGPGAPGGFEFFRDALNPSAAPLAGDDFRDWSDRLRDVEEMVDDPELRAEAARIRDRARGIRSEMKRHSNAPNWDLIRVEVSAPLVELRNRMAEELLRRTNKDAILPLDRDPVPPKYSEKTRRYYEQLGSGE